MEGKTKNSKMNRVVGLAKAHKKITAAVIAATIGYIVILILVFHINP